VIPQDCDYELADTLFKEGRAAMTINGPWSWTGFRSAGVDIGLVPIPEIASLRTWPSPMVSYRGYSISRSCPETRLGLAQELVTYLASPDVQMNYARRIGSLPSLVALQEKDVIQNDPLLYQSMAQVRLGKRMPIIPEMRAIWDAMRPHLQNVMNGESSPEEAARAMQEEAVQKIAEMKG
jgi:maltose-binding protein MalE